MDWTVFKKSMFQYSRVIQKGIPALARPDSTLDFTFPISHVIGGRQVKEPEKHS